VAEQDEEALHEPWRVPSRGARGVWPFTGTPGVRGAGFSAQSWRRIAERGTAPRWNYCFPRLVRVLSEVPYFIFRCRLTFRHVPGNRFDRLLYLRVLLLNPPWRLLAIFGPRRTMWIPDEACRIAHALSPWQALRDGGCYLGVEEEARLLDALETEESARCDCPPCAPPIDAEYCPGFFYISIVPALCPCVHACRTDYLEKAKIIPIGRGIGSDISARRRIEEKYLQPVSIGFMFGFDVSRRRRAFKRKYYHSILETIHATGSTRRVACPTG